MRVVIDLQSCQSGSAPETLPLAQRLVRTAGEHEVFVVLSGRFPGSIEPIRHVLSSLLPRERIAVYDLPSPDGGGSPWRENAAGLIRESFLAGLEPDLVFVPHPLAGAGTVFSAGACSADFVTMVSLSELDCPRAPGPGASDRTAAHSRPHAALRGAITALCSSERVLAAAGIEPGAARVVEIEDARHLWAAFVATPAARQSAVAGTALPRRPRLAYVSPLPPEMSGIADYSAELVPELTRHYEIDLIVDQAAVSDPRLSSGFTVRPATWFRDHGREYDRVLYHFGNSPLHKHLFELIAVHPGVVVLHDFFLSNLIDRLESDDYLPQGFLRELYAAHGYAGLLEHRATGRVPAIWKYPLNKSVLDAAAGVIVHSEYSRSLAAAWYGRAFAGKWRRVPLLRGTAAEADRASARARARRSLGLEGSDFTVCSLGMIGPTKLNGVLLEAFLASPLADDPRCKLVFVGENDPGEYGQRLAAAIGASSASQRIRITGFVDAGAYADWVTASDVCVQLRANSRGETSAALLDCLLRGAPTICNLHGAAAELPTDVVATLSDPFTPEELVAALVDLRRDPARRERLARGARAHVLAHHAPRLVGERYRDAIEHFAERSPHARRRKLLEAMTRIPGHPAASDRDLADVAAAVAANQPATPPRQLLVDVSALARTDLKTGIQRVVRSILLALIASPPPGFRVEAVASVGHGQCYRYARGFTLELIGEPGLPLEDDPVELRPGDLFLGLDLCIDGTHENRFLLQSMRDRGVSVYFVVFDILPVALPAMFPPGTEQHFSAYLDTIAAVSDGLVCISRAVADELSAYLSARPRRRLAPLGIGAFHLGADIDASAPTAGLPPDAGAVLRATGARPTFLIVGTVEPRKGHAQALAAFDVLWDQGADLNLVIVGKQGWMVDALADRLRAHPERERRLFWLPDVSDEMLLELYARSSALLAPSAGEGFGLPLIEAARRGLAIIARDLPVFREVAGSHAWYFAGLEARDLAGAVRAWLDALRAGTAPRSTDLPWLTWDESLRQLLNVIERQQWHGVIP